MSLRIIGYFGLPIIYRIEARKNATVVILFLRTSTKNHIDGTGAIIYENQPRTIHITDAKPVEECVFELIPECISRAFAPNKKTGMALRQKYAKDLPLAVLITADFERLAKECNWNRNTRNDYEKKFELLTQGIGEIPFSQITQERFAAHLREGDFSDNQIDGQIRAMRCLVGYEERNYLIRSHFMDNFALDNRRKVVGPRDAGRHFDKNHLTLDQARKLFEACTKRISEKRGCLYLGVILLLTSGITVSELCALTCDSFNSIRFYESLIVIKVSQEAKPAGNSYKVEPLPTSRARIVPLPPAVAALYRKYKEGMPNTKDDLPLMGSAKNAARRMRPDEFEKWLKVFLKSELGFAHENTEQNLMKHPSRVLRESLRAAADVCGCDEEEIHYLLGEAHKSVFARNYCCYEDHRELAKLAAQLERYAAYLADVPQGASEFKMSRANEKYAVMPAAGCRLTGKLVFDLSKVTADNLEAGKDLVLNITSNDNTAIAVTIMQGGDSK